MSCRCNSVNNHSAFAEKVKEILQVSARIDVATAEFERHDIDGIFRKHLLGSRQNIKFVPLDVELEQINMGDLVLLAIEINRINLDHFTLVELNAEMIELSLS